MTDTADCPYCGFTHHDMHELAPFDGEFKCDGCGETFYLYVQPRLSVETSETGGSE